MCLNTYNINLGSEIYLKNRNSISVNLGFIRSSRPPGGLMSVTSLSTQGIKFQIEGKHYIGKYKLFEPVILLLWPHISQYKSQTLLNSGYYYSIQSALQQTATKREGKNYNQIHNPDDFYTVNRTVYRINFKIGYQCIKKHGFTIDYAIGIGAKYIYSNSRNYSTTNNSWPDNEKDIPWNKLFDTGDGLYPDFVYQLKIGWSF